uniref:ATP synthase gamma subunit n=1 Tax=Carsonella ruddii TaxID=114186 RepID=Q93UD1_CARRU|nr:ATP synthase gamma subunit [Candidatus Carsonella ruddii]
MIIKEIKTKIKIVSNINKLSNTMSMISMSKMNKYQKFLNILNNLFEESRYIYSFIYNYKNNKNCLFVITSNKGLCGSFNNEIIKKTLNYIKNNFLDLFLIGKKGIEFFSKKNIKFRDKIFFSDNEKICNIFFDYNIIEKILNYKNIIFINSKYENKIKICKNNLLIKIKKIFFEIFNFNKLNFIKKFYNYSLKNFFIENFYCELKSRMITMKSASDNSKKILKNMKIIKNKIRQFKVTQEMLEIINGSEK